ncbi:rhamnose ABC transporter substrate-binding protein [Modestobacter marinus]|uniref:rhamnose ABC transporter substrate-binding protein n=1 Tax=Modestobacter marinus TaxID=477641 RepID=UPI001C949F51|nr:rhamnose ABC transporter substrate-binding protein [Modestobacter marinus]
MTSFLTARRLLTGTAIAALVVTTAACGGTTRGEEETAADAGAGASANPDADIPSGLAIAFLPKQLNNPYFAVADAGGERAVQEIDGEFSEVGPTEASASSQVSYINTLTQQGADVIVTSANDPNAICSALDQARAGGANVVTFDSDTSPECRDLFINQATPQGIAEAQIDLMSEQIGGSGQVAILSATANATNQNAWIELMKSYAAEAHPGLEIVTTVYGDDEDEKSFQETQGLLQTYPDLKGIISPTTVGISAAARYLSGSEYKGRVALTGLGTPNQMREFVKDGTVTAFALWNPEDLGYLAAYAGAALAAGQITGAEGETFEAGELGEYTVGADGEVVLGDPTVFNADNIDDFDF